MGAVPILFTRPTTRNRLLRVCPELTSSISCWQCAGPPSCAGENRGSGNQAHIPATKLTFEFDTEAQELRLPQVKLIQLRATLGRWQSTRNPTKRQLQSLIGVIKHAASQSSRQAEIYYFGDVMRNNKMERLRCVWLLVKTVLL